MIRNSIILLIFAGALSLVLLPFGYKAVFDGHYTLTVCFSEAEAIDFSSVRLATCWQEPDADYAVATGTSGETPFHTGEIVADRCIAIDVPYSGRSNIFGQIISYHEPPDLVIEYKSRTGAESVARKRFSIPLARGDREIRVAVP